MASCHPLEQDRLRIAICHPDLGIGGAERLVVDAALELACRGHHVRIFTAHHDPSRCFDETKDGKLAVSVYGDFLPRHLLRRFHALCAYIRCVYVALCIALFWHRFDVILSDQVSAAIPFLRLASSKVLFYCHFPDLLLARHTGRLRRLYRTPIDWLEERTTGMADVVLVNSKFTASIFAATFTTLHSKGVRPTVLYPSVDIRQFPVNSRLQFTGQDHTFLSINRFERKKKIDLAISAFALLLAKNRDAACTSGKRLKLVIAGGYDERLQENRECLSELKQLAAEKEVGDCVVFLPSCSTGMRDELLVSCLCLLYTPMYEHFGIVPLEAMAAQKPVIACNSGGPRETVVHDVTGFLCEPTPQSFSSAMDVFLCEPEKAVKMGFSARQHIQENFSRDMFGNRLNNIVTNILN